MLVIQGNRSDKELQALHREMDIMHTLTHPNIITMIETFDSDDHVRCDMM